MKVSSIIFLFMICFLFGCHKKPKRNLSLEHQKALSDFQIMDGFEIELFAAEPLVADPVAMEIDEHGDMYVVEMHGYPLDLSNSGKIKCLTDTNHDGFPDSSTVWAEGLTLPTGIQKWKKGFIVTDAPNVWYLEDSNNDGKADKKEKMLSGFALSNPQHNLNTPRFELDNWIYLGHEGSITPFVFKKEFGDEGSEIFFANSKKASLDKNANGKMVRFKPDSFEIEELSGETQFGHTQNAYGERIYTSNANHLFHEVLDKKYLQNNPNFLIPEATQNIPDHGDAAEIYPTTENPNDQLLTDKGVITSSCGVTWYLGGAFGKKFNNVTFIAEPVHNLVHADIMNEAGASFSASRLNEGHDFLSSKDPWFRPVNFYIGPDGALYVIDYYRQLIEHPEWMSDEINKSGALYNGKDKGRIYRISKKGSESAEWMHDTAFKNRKNWTKLLDSPNIWQRRTAQRLIFHENNKARIPELISAFKNAKHDESKIHYLWLLHALKGINRNVMELALSDPNAGIKCNALKIYESTPLLDLNHLVQKLCADQDPKVRFQAMNSLGLLGKLENNVAFMKDAQNDKWFGIGLIAASKNQEMNLLKNAVKAQVKNPEFFAYLAASIANSQDKAAMNALFETIQKNTTNKEVAGSLLNGLQKIWSYYPPKNPLSDATKTYLLNNVLAEGNLLGTNSYLLLEQFGLPRSVDTSISLAKKILENKTLNETLRANSLSLLALHNEVLPKSQMEAILLEKANDDLKFTLAQTLIRTRKTSDVYASWKQFSPKTKAQIIDEIAEKEDLVGGLLSAFEQNIIDKKDISWPRSVSLMNYYDLAIRKKARAIFAINEDRKAVLQTYLTVINNKGNEQKGQAIFEKSCASCHIIGAQKGVDFGPNLSSIKNRNVTNIITEIINPNNSIADKYDYWAINLRNKDMLSGIISSESSESITLKQVGGVLAVIKKSEVLSKEKQSYSAMPNGLEASISKTDMADLVAYLKK